MPRNLHRSARVICRSPKREEQTSVQWEERYAEALCFPRMCIFLSGAPLCLLSPDSEVRIHPSPDLVLALSRDRSAEMRNKRNSRLSPPGGSSAPLTVRSSVPLVSPGAAGRFLSRDWLSGVVLGTPPALPKASLLTIQRIQLIHLTKNLIDSPHRKSVSPLVVLLACVRTHHTPHPHIPASPH